MSKKMTKLEFDNKMDAYKASDAPIEVKEEAIKKLQEEYPEYSGIETGADRIKKELEESSADIEDVLSSY